MKVIQASAVALSAIWLASVAAHAWAAQRRIDVLAATVPTDIRWDSVCLWALLGSAAWLALGTASAMARRRVQRRVEARLARDGAP